MKSQRFYQGLIYFHLNNIDIIFINIKASTSLINCSLGAFFDVCDIIVVLIIGSFTVSLSPGQPNLCNWLVQTFSGGTFSNKFKEYSASSWRHAITWLQYPLSPGGHSHKAFSTKLQ